MTLSDWLAIAADVASVTAFVFIWILHKQIKRQNGNGGHR